MREGFDLALTRAVADAVPVLFDLLQKAERLEFRHHAPPRFGRHAVKRSDDGPSG